MHAIGLTTLHCLELGNATVCVFGRGAVGVLVLKAPPELGAAIMSIHVLSATEWLVASYGARLLVTSV